MRGDTRSGGSVLQPLAAGCGALLLTAAAACGGGASSGAGSADTAPTSGASAQESGVMQPSAATSKAGTSTGGAPGMASTATAGTAGSGTARSQGTSTGGTSTGGAAAGGGGNSGASDSAAAVGGMTAGAMTTAAVAGAAGSTPPAGGAQCPERKGSTTEARLHMHHIHFNTQDPGAAIEFVQKYFNAMPFDYCTSAGGQATRASKTERAYFLYTKVDAPPSNMRLNRLAHIGYMTSDVAGELKRLNELKVPLADASVCATAAMGTPCNTSIVQWFYVDMPESARFEIASGPGPATSGFGHIHLVAPDYSFFMKVLGEALQDPNGNPNVDEVNMVASGRTGVLDETIMYQDTRGAAIDHVGFSTGDLEGTQKRIEAAGIKIEEPISLKPEGFRSFMVRSSEGIWLEILEGDGFKK